MKVIPLPSKTGTLKLIAVDPEAKAQRVERMRRMRASGSTLADIAAEFGLSSQRVSSILKRAGVFTTDDDVQVLLRQVEQFIDGHKWAPICECSKVR